MAELSLLDTVIATTTRTGCEHCGSSGGDFVFEGHHFCCECMSGFCNWILDGGIESDPEVFSWVFGREGAEP